MKKIKVALESIVDDIKSFYDYKTWHFITINGVSLKDNILEVQWIFSKYEVMDEIVIFYAECDYKDIIPSIAAVIPSAIIFQRELVDMFGVKVAALYFEENSAQMPFRPCRL